MCKINSKSSPGMHLFGAFLVINLRSTQVTWRIGHLLDRVISSLNLLLEILNVMLKTILLVRLGLRGGLGNYRLACLKPRKIVGLLRQHVVKLEAKRLDEIGVFSTIDAQRNVPFRVRK